jgi:hypothetical protein
VSELPPSIPGADPSARARASGAAAPAERWLRTIEQAARAIRPSSQAIRRATRGGPLHAAKPARHAEQLLVHCASVEVEIGAAGAGLPDTRRLTGAAGSARRFGLA